MVNNVFSWNNIQNTNEQSLAESILAESIQIYGMDVYYAPRQLNAKDPVFGEDPLASFTKYYTIEMYLQNVDGYEGDEAFISKFGGYRMSPGATLLCSKMRFNEVIKEQGAYALTTDSPQYQDVRPMEGDIIYLPMDKTLWQITNVTMQRPFFMLGEVTLWTINMKKYAYASEVLATGRPEIDDIQTLFSQQQSSPSDNTVTDPIADNSNVITSGLIDRSTIDPFSGGNY